MTRTENPVSNLEADDMRKNTGVMFNILVMEESRELSLL